MRESNKLRDMFKSKGLTYKDVTRKDIDRLVSFIKNELKTFYTFPMRVRYIRKGDINFENGELKHCYIMVDGDYFKRREAISFNKDGFIGFAGELSTENTIPFFNAFESWINTFGECEHPDHEEVINQGNGDVYYTFGLCGGEI